MGSLWRWLPGIGTAAAAVLLWGAPHASNGAEVRAEGGKTLDVGLRVQTWAQWYDKDVPGKNPDQDRFDAVIRRAYLYVQGKAHPRLYYFVHIAGDRFGQVGLDSPAIGVGTGLALRDAWTTLDYAEQFKVQVGRMYVPFTRAFGTEGAFAMQALDAATASQGDMIPGRRAGRDDGVAVWGNLEQGHVQYRIAAMDGANASAGLRWAGRLSVTFGTPDTGWFTSGVRLDGKRLLSISAGFDSLPDFAAAGEDHSAWTVDAYCVHPFGKRAIAIAQAAYAAVDQEEVVWTGDWLTGCVGVYLKKAPFVGSVHPYVRYERFDADHAVSAPPALGRELSAGLNLYPYDLGNSGKVTLDWTRVRPSEGEAYSRLTAQMQVGF
jgi:hypothetical protein